MQLGGSGTGASYTPKPVTGGVGGAHATDNNTGASIRKQPVVYKAPAKPTPKYNTAPAPGPSGKTIGSSPTGAIKPIAPAKPVPAWTADQDTTYQQQELAAHTALTDYLSGQTTAQDQYNIENTRNDKNLQDQQKVADTNMADDYASRGMSTSGLMLKAHGLQDDEYAKQQSILDQGALNFGTTAKSNLNNFKATQGINDTKYKNDAINRHAASFGLI